MGVQGHCPKCKTDTVFDPVNCMRCGTRNPQYKTPPLPDGVRAGAIADALSLGDTEAVNELSDGVRAKPDGSGRWYAPGGGGR